MNNIDLSNIDGASATLGLVVLIALLFIFLGVHVVPDGNCRIVERLGRRHRVLMPGVNIVFPILDRVKKTGIDLVAITKNGTQTKKLYTPKGNISLAEQRMDPAELRLIAKDNSEIFVDTVAYFRIVEPMRAVYDVAAFSESFMSIIETTLRQEVGKFDGDTIITSRDIMSENLRSALQEAATAWGILIIRVEVEDIRFDPVVTEKLSEARKQELIRRAEVVAAQAKADIEVVEAEAKKKAGILAAEGIRQAAIQTAEGEKIAQVLRAEGEFEEQKLQAEGKFLLASREQEGVAQGYKAISDALAANPNAIIALEALKSQEKVADSLGKSQNTMILPAETAGLFGAFAATLKGVGQLANINEKK